MERFAIFGMGLFGRRLARLLAEAGADVMAIDQDKELVALVRDSVSLAVCLDSTNEQALLAQGIDKVDAAIVGIGGAFESAALTTALLKQIGVKRVISRATSEVRGRILLRIGADEIVDPEREAAERWRNRLMLPAILERAVVGDGFSLVQIAAPKSFVGQTLGDLDIRKKHGVNVVGIRRQPPETQGESQVSETVISVPMADTRIEASDVLLLIGGDEALADFPAK